MTGSLAVRFSCKEIACQILISANGILTFHFIRFFLAITLDIFLTDFKCILNVVIVVHIIDQDTDAVMILPAPYVHIINKTIYR